MKKLPIGVQTFEKLIRENYLYVDKTEHIYQLVTRGECYFLARPRRFGKSLLVSTLKALFEAKRELFVGLWIDSSDYAWDQYAVLDFNFSKIAHSTPGELNKTLLGRISELARLHDIPIDLEFPVLALNELVFALSRMGKKVVFLIDEYDYPLLTHLTRPQHRSEIQGIMRSFYAAIKGLDEYARFVFLTGVSKFSQTSVFSGMNNLEDISFSTPHACMLGYTHSELEQYFSEYVAVFAGHKNCSTRQLVEKLTEWYDGYCFARGAERVYNPFSVLSSMKAQEFRNFWFKTGTPTFLADLLVASDYAVQEIDGVQVEEGELETMDLEFPRLIPLLFQTGYLTIKGSGETTDLLTLGYPNHEVADSFTKFLVQYLTHRSPVQVKRDVGVLLSDLQDNDIDAFCTRLKIVFANIPHTIHLKYEKYYQSLFYLLLHVMGAEIDAEVATNSGRIDAVVKMANRIVIIEFKLGAFADKALDQIIEKKYYEKHLADAREILLLGIAFDTKLNNVGECRSLVLARPAVILNP
jgi:hypothetical protein